VALAIGAEKLTHPDKSITFGAYASGVDVEERERLQREAPKDRSLFMDIYADRARSVEKDHKAHETEHYRGQHRASVPSSQID
jgi:hypothetical protein